MSGTVLDFDGDSERTLLLWSLYSQVVAVLKMFSFSSWRRSDCSALSVFSTA